MSDIYAALESGTHTGSAVIAAVPVVGKREKVGGLF